MKCEDCDFLANDDLSLEVHSARKHSGDFECALCGFMIHLELPVRKIRLEPENVGLKHRQRHEGQ